MLTGPLVFESSPRPMVWGGRDLANVLNKPLPDLQIYGEAWEVSDHPRHGSIARSGANVGQSLRRLMEEHAEAIVGHNSADRFPWLLKWLDCNDWLSVQVHPDADQVKRFGREKARRTRHGSFLERVRAPVFGLAYCRGSPPSSCGKQLPMAPSPIACIHLSHAREIASICQPEPYMR
jgi:hypothetical protein